MTTNNNFVSEIQKEGAKAFGEVYNLTVQKNVTVSKKLLKFEMENINNSNDFLPPSFFFENLIPF